MVYMLIQFVSEVTRRQSVNHISFCFQTSNQKLTKQSQNLRVQVRFSQFTTHIWKTESCLHTKSHIRLVCGYTVIDYQIQGQRWSNYDVVFFRLLCARNRCCIGRSKVRLRQWTNSTPRFPSDLNQCSDFTINILSFALYDNIYLHSLRYWTVFNKRNFSITQYLN